MGKFHKFSLFDVEFRKKTINIYKLQNLDIVRWLHLHLP